MLPKTFGLLKFGSGPLAYQSKAQSTVNANRPTPRARLNHIQDFALLWEWKAAKQIVPCHIPGSVINSADSLTKSLGSTLTIGRHVCRLADRSLRRSLDTFSLLMFVPSSRCTSVAHCKPLLTMGECVSAYFILATVLPSTAHSLLHLLEHIALPPYSRGLLY